MNRPALTVTGVAPANGPFAGGTAVTLTGSGFTGATNVAFGSVNIPATGFTVVDDWHITVASPPGAPGTDVDVTVTTPWGTSATNAGTRFTYNLVLTGVPSVLPLTQRQLFAPGLIACGGGTPPYTYEITAGSLPGGIGLYTYFNDCYFHGTTEVAAGSYPVTLTVTDGAGRTGSQQYTLVVNPAGPAVAALSPTHGPAVGGTVVTLTGSSFTGATNVAFGAVNIPATGFAVVDASHITVASPAGAPGTAADVTVTTPWGTSATNASARFTYNLALTGVPSILPATRGAEFGPGLISCVGGTPPYIYTITAGSLPSGIELYRYLNECYFSGTTYDPVGAYSVTVTVTDANGATGSQVYSITLNPAVPTATTLAATDVGVTTATLRSTVNPGGGSTTAFFQYGTDPALSNLVSTLVWSAISLATYSQSGILRHEKSRQH